MEALLFIAFIVDGFIVSVAFFKTCCILHAMSSPMKNTRKHMCARHWESTASAIKCKIEKHKNKRSEYL